MRRTRRTRGIRRTGVPVTVLLSLAAVALSLLAACSGGGEPGSPPSGPAVDPAGLAAAIVGTWRPERIAGYRLPPAYPRGLSKATITFEHRGAWHGSDGCNALAGTYRVGPDGSLTATAGPQTLIGCANVPNGVVVTSAARVEIDEDRLSFLDDGGAVLGSYARL